MDCVGNFEFDPRIVQPNRVYDPLDVSSLPTSRYRYYVFDPGSQLYTSLADYGICQFWQLSHVARDKQNYVSEVLRRLSMRRAR